MCHIPSRAKFFLYDRISIFSVILFTPVLAPKPQNLTAVSDESDELRAREVDVPFGFSEIARHTKFETLYLEFHYWHAKDFLDIVSK